MEQIHPSLMVGMTGADRAVGHVELTRALRAVAPIDTDIGEARQQCFGHQLMREAPAGCALHVDRRDDLLILVEHYLVDCFGWLLAALDKGFYVLLLKAKQPPQANSGQLARRHEF